MIALIGWLVGVALLYVSHLRWALVCRVAAVLVFLGATLAATGLPRDQTLYLPGENDYILAYTLDEPRAIYVWVQTDGGPLSVKLPWSTPQAQQLQEGMAQIKQRGGKLKVGRKTSGDATVFSPLGFVPNVQANTPKSGS